MEAAFPILARLATPSELLKMGDRELRELADEVRAAILGHVSRTGGHLSSNLGTVELTVALYASFDLERDKAVWDTGHQAYPHKILTGRLERFPTLRQHGGLSGFLKRDESPYDHFGAGHAGTAVSAAIGMAEARDTLAQDHRVLAVVGDASIASGMSWEALNHAGETGLDVTVVLNDNRMSIAPNVGALTNYLARLRSRPGLQSLARKAKGAIEKLPDPMVRAAAGLRHGITHALAPEETGTIFEEIGWEYIGPADGHDLPTLVEIFRNVRELPGPVFVHALTVKGKGYEAAESDARKWHGVVPFDPAEAVLKKATGPLTFTQAFGSAAAEAAEADPTVVAITAAMPDGTGLTEFAARFPDRFHDVGIAEQHAIGLAAGMAAAGLKPFCAIYSTFLQRGFDQALHDVAIQHLPVRFFLDRAGLVGDDGPTHHGVFDLAMLGMIPGFMVCAPRDTDDLRAAVAWAAGYDDGPCAVRYPRGAGDPRLPERRAPFALGRAELLIDDESPEVAFVALGSTVGPAYGAALALRERGVRAAVLDARWLRPLDETAILALAERSGLVIFAEEGVRRGGFGVTCRDLLADHGVATPTRIAAIPDDWVQHGTQAILRGGVGLDEAGLLRMAEEAGIGLLGKVK